MRSPHKYKTRHQSRRECRRRLRQVKAGHLSGFVKARLSRPAAEFVSEDARYAAHGLIAPAGLQLVEGA